MPKINISEIMHQELMQEAKIQEIYPEQMLHWVLNNRYRGGYFQCMKM